MCLRKRGSKVVTVPGKDLRFEVVSVSGGELRFEVVKVPGGVLRFEVVTVSGGGLRLTSTNLDLIPLSGKCGCCCYRFQSR